MSDITPVAHPEIPYHKSEIGTINRAAQLLRKEAKSWADGFVIGRENGKLIWRKEDEWAHVRHHELISVADRLDGIVARFVKKGGNT